MPTATLANLGSKPGLSAAYQAMYDTLKFGIDIPEKNTYVGFEPWLTPGTREYERYQLKYGTPKVETFPWGTVTHPPAMMAQTMAMVSFNLRNKVTGEEALYVAPSGGYTVTPASGWEVVPAKYGPLPAVKVSPPAPKKEGFEIPWWGWALGTVGVLAIFFWRRA